MKKVCFAKIGVKCRKYCRDEGMEKVEESTHCDGLDGPGLVDSSSSVPSTAADIRGAHFRSPLLFAVAAMRELCVCAKLQQRQNAVIMSRICVPSTKVAARRRRAARRERGCGRGGPRGERARTAIGDVLEPRLARRDRYT